MQVALHLDVRLNVVAQLGKVILREVLHADAGIDAGFSEDLLGGRQTDAVDVGQADFNALVARKVDTNKTCHRLYLLFLPSPDAAYGGGSRK